MPERHGAFDRVFLSLTLGLVFVGFLVFSSASLGILARGTIDFSSIAFSQFLLGVCGGLIAFSASAYVPYRLYSRIAPVFFLVALLLTFTVFIPGLGYAANGAQRWIAVAGVSLQPAEILKLATVLFVAWYYSTIPVGSQTMLRTLGGAVATLCVVAVPLFLQPDIGTFVILASAVAAIVFVSAPPWKHLFFLGGALLVALAVVGISRPYVLERITTFWQPFSVDVRDEGYQIRQSLIAIGSGGVWGRGYGQSVQKFGYLPEATSDSLFSVAAEEVGFVGASLIVLLFLAFSWRGLSVGLRARDRFGTYIVVGFIVMCMIQTFLNIGSMLGVFPLTGEPLVFMSQGGSSLFFALLGAGIILNVSRYTKGRYTAVV